MRDDFTASLERALMPLIDRGLLEIKPLSLVGGDAVPRSSRWRTVGPEGAIGPLGQSSGGTVITTLPIFCPVSTYR
jgi:hypothetical protein